MVSAPKSQRSFGTSGGLPAGSALIDTWVVSALRSPVGPWLGSPFVGYFCILNTIGRSGRLRATPMPYAIVDAKAYVPAGLGGRPRWLDNIKRRPHVLLELPGREIEGTATLVTDPEEQIRAAVAIWRGAGLALLNEGLNPAAPTSQLRAALGDKPVVRVVAADGSDIRAGVHDPGGVGWTALHLGVPALTVGLAILAGHRRHSGDDEPSSPLAA